MPAMLSPEITLADRVAGCLLGGALGDALGGPYENSPAPVALAPDAVLSLSDDTQLTLATCEAIVAARGPDPERIAAAFAVLFEQRQIRGIGASTFKALQELAAGGHWALVGSKGERAAGNGPATRIAPLAFLLDPADATARQTIRDVCRITHHNDEAYCGALAVLAGEAGLIREITSMLPDSAVRDRLIEISSVGAKEPLSDVARRESDSAIS
ncbi:MAG: ADP-ribosylglycohydrolase family protein [Pirellulales bacterium]